MAKTLDSGAKKLCGANKFEGFWNLGGNWRGVDFFTRGVGVCGSEDFGGGREGRE